MKKGILYSGIVLVFILTIAVILIQVNRPNNPITNNDSYTEASGEPQTVNVTANNGTFEPSDFSLMLSESLVLKVNAVDRDYFFAVDGYPRLDATILMGGSVSINVSYLGVGTYNYSCGSDCSGSITVLQQSD